MPARPISADRARQYRAAIEGALRDGFDPYRVVAGGRGSCVPEAVRRLRAAGDAKASRNKLQGFIRAQERARARGEPNEMPDWALFVAPGAVPGAIQRQGVRRWLLTAAQDDTDVHRGFLANLQAYAADMRAEIIVAGFTYQKALYEDHQTQTALYRPEVARYLRFDPVDLGPVIFFANVNILPTAERPLQGLQTHSRGRPAVFPHAKLQLETVPAMPGQRPPMVCTTGAVTLPNYIQKKAGQKAELHHIFGATMVEVTAAGDWFLRPISAAGDGSFQDLDAVVRDGRVTRGARVRAITWGDVHLPYLPDHIRRWCWGREADSMLAALRPQTQFFHDLMDFRMTNRHVDGDPHHRARLTARGEASVSGQVLAAARFLRETQRDFCQSVVIESNHDVRLVRWAGQPDARQDVANARFWHLCNVALHEAAEAQNGGFNLVRWALREADAQRLDGVDFVPMGESMVICHETGGIECGLHGHQGPNGSKGTAAGLSRTATRITIGDKHCPQILDGVYVAGVSGNLDQGYNTGPSGWWHAHVVTYPNGKRTIVAQDGEGRWRG